jgi:hypothetical protein
MEGRWVEAEAEARESMSKSSHEWTRMDTNNRMQGRKGAEEKRRKRGAE